MDCIMKKSALLPSVRVTPEFQVQVQKACESLDAQYAVIVKNLLHQWLSGKIHVDMELDADFVASACEALESEEVQAAFQMLAKNHEDKEYPEAIKI